MRLINMSCPNCGSQLQIDLDNKQASCPYCGNTLLIDDGVQHIQYDNAENAGYEFEKGRQRAQAEQLMNYSNQSSNTKYWQQPQNQKKKKTMVWWVIGWILFFPIPLTILLARDKSINPKVRYGIIAGMWIILLIVGLVRNNGANDNFENTTVQDVKISEEETTELTSEANTDDTSSPDVSKVIDDLVESINSKNNVVLTYVEDFTPSDKKSYHYRTEFRLNAYKEAIGKSYSYDGTTVDIVSHDTIMGGTPTRIYMNSASLQQCKDMIENAAPILDCSISDNDIQETINYIDEKHRANGYYIGNSLGLVISKNGEDSYKFMLKND